MPLSATTEQGARVTALDYPAPIWDQMRGNSKRTEVFFCQWCHAPMHPKRNPWGTRFFAHNPGSDCPFLEETGGESSAHLAIKGALVHTINGVGGWHGEAEVRHGLPGGGHYVVDVVARHKTKQRPAWAWEVQLQAQSEADARRRTDERMQGHGRVNWVTRQDWSWSTAVPSVRVNEKATHVVGGLVEQGEYQDDFNHLPPLTLGQSVRTLLSGGFMWVGSVGWVKADTWSGPLNRRAPNQHEGRDHEQDVHDYCDRSGMVGANPFAPHVRSRPHFTARWQDVDWIGRADMARARRHAGRPLDDIDREALMRWPHPIPHSEIDFYEKKASDMSDPFEQSAQ